MTDDAIELRQHRFQLSDKRRDAILVARGDDPVEVVAAFDTLLTTFDNTFGTMPPAQHQTSPAEQMVQRPVNQPGGLGATPVQQQSSGGDVLPCPRGGRPHTFASGIGRSNNRPWRAWDCPDYQCLNDKGKNRTFI